MKKILLAIILIALGCISFVHSSSTSARLKNNLGSSKGGDLSTSVDLTAVNNSDKIAKCMKECITDHYQDSLGPVEVECSIKSRIVKKSNAA